MFHSLSILLSQWLTSPVATLYTLEGPVFSMAFSRNGEYLAVGGPEGLMAWNMTSLKSVRMPVQFNDQRISVSCIAWATGHKDKAEIVCYGNSLGYLVFMRLNTMQNEFEIIASMRLEESDSSSEITSIAVHDNGPDIQVAVGTRDSSIFTMVFKSDELETHITPVHSKTQTVNGECFTKALAFDGTKDNNLFVFGIHDGILRKIAGSDFQTIVKFKLRTHIGHADVDLHRQLCAVDNTHNGFDVYDLEGGHHLQTLVTKKACKTYPKGVKYGDNARLVIGGSDHGVVYVFNARTGNIQGKLQHSRKLGAEIVAVRDTGASYVVIASASSTSTSIHSSIKIWHWHTTHPTRGRSWFWTALSFIIQAVIVMAAIAYAVEKYFIMNPHSTATAATVFLESESHIRNAWVIFKKQLGSGAL